MSGTFSEVLLAMSKTCWKKSIFLSFFSFLAFGPLVYKKKQSFDIIIKLKNFTIYNLDIQNPIQIKSH